MTIENVLITIVIVFSTACVTMFVYYCGFYSGQRNVEYLVQQMMARMEQKENKVIQLNKGRARLICKQNRTYTREEEDTKRCIEDI